MEIEKMKELLEQNIVLKVKGIQEDKPFFHNGKLVKVEESGLWIDDIYSGLYFVRYEDIINCRRMNKLDYADKANKLSDRDALKIKLQQTDDKFAMKLKKLLGKK